MLKPAGLVPVDLAGQCQAMRHAAALTSAVVLMACASIALAAPPAATPAPPPQGNTVSPLTIFPKTEAPKIVKSYPAAGQAMSAGVLVMSITFDQPMKPTAFDFGPAAGGEPPHCLKIPRLLDDNKTFVLLCTTDPGKTYALTVNASAEGGFENAAEHRADPSTLSFKTTDGEGPRDIHEAMKAAGLRDSLDMPILETPDRRGEKAPTVAASQPTPGGP
jgi:hypothetical protein